MLTAPGLLACRYRNVLTSKWVRGRGKLSYSLEIESVDQDIISNSPVLSPSDFENPGSNMSYFLVLVCKALSPCPHRGPQELFGTLQFHQTSFREGQWMILTLIGGDLWC